MERGSKKTDEISSEFSKWDKTLSEILELPEFKEQIEQNEYFQSPQNISFRKWIENKFDKTFNVNTATLLSIDFWDSQRPILKDEEYYIIRSGKGSFVIVDGKKYSPPYLNSEKLKKSEENAKNIDVLEPEGYHNLKKAFCDNVLENSALEQLRFNGVYEKMIENVLGEKKQYHVGIRGNNSSEFNVYFNKENESKVSFIYKHKGQTELDYTLWTEDSVFLFEAKKVKKVNNKSLRIGWHKFAYAAARLKDYSKLNIYPVYFLRTLNKVILFVFPKFSFHNRDGVILNDTQQMNPKFTYTVDLKIYH